MPACSPKHSLGLVLGVSVAQATGWAETIEGSLSGSRLFPAEAVARSSAQEAYTDGSAGDGLAHGRPEYRNLVKPLAPAARMDVVTQRLKQLDEEVANVTVKAEAQLTGPGVQAQVLT
ncbi:hypothetical protein WJX75_003554 [Coccomyxa subellipsoidea]|uniref:Uncharacterized protein n=1 Tax=Coccomyxa subellipsoidea TaxID=248742 RepID=A0ABR2Z2G1_9CHLO